MDYLHATDDIATFVLTRRQCISMNMDMNMNMTISNRTGYLVLLTRDFILYRLIDYFPLTLFILFRIDNHSLFVSGSPPFSPTLPQFVYIHRVLYVHYVHYVQQLIIYIYYLVQFNYRNREQIVTVIKSTSYSHYILCNLYPIESDHRDIMHSQDRWPSVRLASTRTFDL